MVVSSPTIAADGSYSFNMLVLSTLKCYYKVQLSTETTPSPDEVKTCNNGARCGSKNVPAQTATSFTPSTKSAFADGKYSIHFVCTNIVPNSQKITAVKTVDLGTISTAVTPDAPADNYTSSSFLKSSMMVLMLLALLFI